VTVPAGLFRWELPLQLSKRVLEHPWFMTAWRPRTSVEVARAVLSALMTALLLDWRLP
jgi:hypothetical protein